MSIVTIATSKGGAGKTTAAQILSGQIAARGHRVAAIDADYNHSLADWVQAFDLPITIHRELDESRLIGLAEELEASHDLLVIDTAGAAMQATVFAIGCADLVLVPCQLSSADVVEAAKTRQLVESAAKMARRDILVRAVLTDYQVGTHIGAHVERELQACGLEALPTRLHRLVAFKEMTFNGVVPTKGPAGAQADGLIADVAALGVLPFLSMKRAS
ncbi:ParA family protein [Rubrimonas cliftonensis]|uniref:Chromosome partitioning protein n=1 Tax=Rubrimonas cliftonensis TaxID=89524 RepID=A0A1H4G0M3_9RHOB|nr:ParA family protein [Rubrimonas cliftonensis]SEB02262.1 chromosome partitioning protein [Rubrimonas cliftonensis]